MKKALYYSVIAIILFIILINICSAFNISIFGVRIFKIASGSMSPSIKVNDLVIVSEKSFYYEGDIVTYKNESGDYVTHRIISIENDIYQTKGDSNNIIDKPISKSDIVGKVIFKPKITTFINHIISSVIFWLIIPIIGITYIFIPKKKKSKE